MYLLSILAAGSLIDVLWCRQMSRIFLNPNLSGVDVDVERSAKLESENVQDRSQQQSVVLSPSFKDRG